MTRKGFCLLCLVPLAGCGMQGNWVLRDVNPADATGQFDIAAATFHRDNTYVAKVRRGDRTEIARGTYDYERWGRKLTLRSGGIERSYTATLWFGVQMNVQGQTSDGTPMTAVLGRSTERVTPEPPSPTPTDTTQ